MSISYGGDKITATDGGSINPLSTIFRNRLIDAGYTINQRGYVSGTALSSGVYAHDRWKAGSGGCTYTFTQGSAGVPITITITAGSLQQVIEGANMPEGGTYVLSWEGTAQARFNGGTYGSSPLAVTGIVAGANTTIEFDTGTVLKPQLEVGTQATSFEYRQYGTELQLCQRYYFRYKAVGTSDNFGSGWSRSTTSFLSVIQFPVTMRTNPTALEQTGVASNYAINRLSTAVTLSSVPTFSSATLNNATLISSVSSGLVAGEGGALRAVTTANAYLGFSAEL
jgi:hypothetical protein